VWIGASQPSWSASLPVALSEVRTIRFTAPDGSAFVASVDPVSPWGT